MADIEILSEGFRLRGELFLGDRDEPVPAVVIAHGFPSGPGTSSYSSMPSLAERICDSMGWNALSFTARGVGGSEGDFSLRGWFTDLCAAIDAAAAIETTTDVFVAGFGTGGALAICTGAHRDNVAGVASLGSPADFDDWARNPRDLLLWARELGAVKSESFPADFAAWSAELDGFRAVHGAEELTVPLLVLHGSADDVVPQFDARAIADAHESADLRIIHGAGHGLRHDPRAVAVLLGWLDRQRYGGTVHSPADEQH